MLSEDKVSHLSHVILTAVKKHAGTTVKSPDERVLKEIKRVLGVELAQEQDIDRKVRSKLASYSRGIVEGVLSGMSCTEKCLKKKRASIRNPNG